MPSSRCELDSSVSQEKIEVCRAASVDFYSNWYAKQVLLDRINVKIYGFCAHRLIPHNILALSKSEAYHSYSDSACRSSG